MPDERTAILIIRAWSEAHPSFPLRASVRLTTDIASGLGPAQTFTDIEAVAAAVLAWLKDIDAGAPGSLPPVVPAV